jgi:16S rRNA (cytosine1402-N4)-methyltransferase
MSPRSDFEHEPVMAAETLAALQDMPAGAFVDATLGGAGHTKALLDARADVVVHGFDQDPDAIAGATDRLADYGARAVVHHARFDNATPELADHRVVEICGFLMDLGVSSPQLDWADRGFSYQHDGPLDMRMNTEQTRTAADVVNSYPVDELIDVLRSYGDERNAVRIAKAIEAHRPIKTTSELATIITEAVPAAVRRQPGHAAKRSFQAIRIEVNDELAILGPALDALIALLVPGGVGVVLTYHSGEDRIVKDRMRTAVEADDLPGMPSRSEFEWLFRGARTASEDEVLRNSRSKSARLRGIRRKVAA